MYTKQEIIIRSYREGKSLIITLATGEYLEYGESVLITAPTGCGKSFLAPALGHQACAQGYKAVYYNVQKLHLKAKISRIVGIQV